MSHAYTESVIGASGIVFSVKGQWVSYHRASCGQCRQARIAREDSYFFNPASILLGAMARLTREEQESLRDITPEEIESVIPRKSMGALLFMGRRR